MKRNILLFVICYSFAYLLNAQTQAPVSSERVMEHMDIQTSLFPMEKLYLHVDRNTYFQGEDIWFKAYLTDAFLRPSATGTRYVYAELINPLDSVVARVMLLPQEDRFHGKLSLADDLAEGYYTLKAYTRYMENMGEDNFFRKTIEIKSVLGAQIRPHYTFNYQNDRKKVNVELYYTSGVSDEKIRPDRLEMRNKKGEMQLVRLDEDPVAHLSFDLPLKDNQRTIYLEADNFKHFIFIPYESEDYEVAFFPESGYLLHGCMTRMAFKAMNSKGISEVVTGEVFDSQGNSVSELETSHAGMGVFAFIPDEAEVYYAECVNNKGLKKRFELPRAVAGVYGLQTNLHHAGLYVGLRHQKAFPIVDDLYLLIHQNGEMLYFAPWEKDKQERVFSWEVLPSGILQVVLFDNNYQPIAERLVFSPVKDEPQIRLKTEKAAYKTREKVSLSMKLTDVADAPLGGDLSVAITDDKDVSIDSLQTIVSAMLLSSELRGKIEDPAYYLQKDNPKASYALDLLMMTQGWRRYDLKQVLLGDYAYPKVQPETGREFTGKVTRLSSSKPIRDGEVTLMVSENEGKVFFDQVMTDKEGRFAFLDLEFPDSAKVFIQSLNEKGKEFVELLLDKEVYPPVDRFDRIFLSKKTERVKPKIDENIALKKAEERAKYNDNMQVIHLKEVTVTAADKSKKEGPRVSAYVSMNTTVVDFKEKVKTKHYTNIADLFYEIPGAQIIVLLSTGAKMVKLRGSEEFAQVLINDIPVSMEGGVDVLGSINVHDVATVEVYKGTDAAIFGMRGANGVINIRMKTGEDYLADPIEEYNKRTLYPLGYQKPVEFYSPKYETPEQRSSYLPDLRTTVYWKPDMVIGEDGQTAVEFYTADTPSTYSIVVEGITKDGKPVRHVQKIQVEQP